LEGMALTGHWLPSNLKSLWRCLIDLSYYLLATSFQSYSR
jgi:hypothetical protein